MQRAQIKVGLEQLLESINQLNQQEVLTELGKIAQAISGGAEQPCWAGLAIQNDAFRKEIQHFVDRVSEGTIKSRSTFARYQRVLSDNKVIPEARLADIKADAIIEAKEATREAVTDGGARWLCGADDLEEYAENLRKG